MAQTEIELIREIGFLIIIYQGTHDKICESTDQCQCTDFYSSRYSLLMWQLTLTFSRKMMGVAQNMLL